MIFLIFWLLIYIRITLYSSRIRVNNSIGIDKKDTSIKKGTGFMSAPLYIELLFFNYTKDSSWLLADVCKDTAVNVKDVAVYEVGSV